METTKKSTFKVLFYLKKNAPKKNGKVTAIAELTPIFKINTITDFPTKDLFEFISQEHSPKFDLGLFSLLPDAQGEDYEEEQFINRLNKKKKKGKRL